MYLHQKQLKEVLHYRQRLRNMREFIYTCRHRAELLDLLKSKTYMLEDDIHAYSMDDLVKQHLKKLVPFLSDVLSKYKMHIMNQCETCHGKGDYCEICNSRSVIFPFQPDTTKCPKCSALYHKSCFSPYKIRCPKCARVDAIKNKM